MSAPSRHDRQAVMPMSDDGPSIRHDALSPWDRDACALSATAEGRIEAWPILTNDDLVLLRVRVIALENILIAVLAEGSERQRQTARDMSDALSTQPGSARHPLTIRAAHHMVGLVHRAAHARDVTS